MLVYLDQKDWIELTVADRQPARARKPYREILDLVRRLKADGLRVVLSEQRYFETMNTRSLRRRRDVAALMRELSGFETLVSAKVSLAVELTKEFGKHYELTSRFNYPMVGYGVAHALGLKGMQVRSHDPDASADQLERMNGLLGATYAEFAAPFEFKILAGEPYDKQHQQGLQHFVGGYRANILRFAEEENRSQNLILEHAGAGRHELDRLVRAQTFWSFRDEILDAAHEAGVSTDQVLALCEPTGAFVRSVPGLDVVSALRSRRFRQAPQPWKPNDLADVMSLRQAIPYCDIVSTDKGWAHVTNSTDLSTRYGTTIVGKPAELYAALQAISLGDER